jgi:hypothetical protein
MVKNWFLSGLKLVKVCLHLQKKNDCSKIEMNDKNWFFLNHLFLESFMSVTLKVCTDLVSWRGTTQNKLVLIIVVPKVPNGRLPIKRHLSIILENVIFIRRSWWQFWSQTRLNSNPYPRAKNKFTAFVCKIRRG